MFDSMSNPVQSGADILIVDDKADNIRLLSSMLLDQGYTVRKALNGNMALTAVRTLLPDLILLDINMPQMDGYTLCQTLKQDAQTQKVPVIFLSALDDTIDKVRAFQVGGIDYITKPFQIEEVLARIENQLTLHRQRQELIAQKAKLEQEIQERKRAEAELEWQRQRAEELLLNIFPKTVADQLKSGQQTIASSFDSVTVLFADLVGFTALAASIAPTELVQLLSQVFSRFDGLVESHQLEKIKTIGDAYMVVGGAPLPREDHAQTIANFALDIQRVIAEFQTSLGNPLQLRIGINSGPVVAGVIGVKKFSYDLWGDTVNVASRMESQGEPGRIQVTETTYQLLRQDYCFETRGTIALKGRGELKTYWLVGRA
jgi:class 3 adenylate cyclase